MIREPNKGPPTGHHRTDTPVAAFRQLYDIRGSLALEQVELGAAVANPDALDVGPEAHLPAEVHRGVHAQPGGLVAPLQALCQ